MKTYDAFPEPIGGYTVGRTQMDFEYTASDHSKRELTAFMYYPSDSSEGKTPSTYMFPEVYEMLHDQPLVTEYLKEKDFFSIDIKTHCYDDLALSGKEKRYPVLFYVCGGGGSPEWGTVICTDLASMGYVVVSIGHQNSTMYKRKDGRLFNVSKDFSDVIMAFSEDQEMRALAGKMEMRPDDETAIEMCRNVLQLPILDKLTEYSELQAEDVRYVADYLYKLDSGELNSIFKRRLLLDIGMGIVGHSYGGPTTAIVCRDDDRFACGIGLDSGAFGLLDSDLKKPFLLLFCEPNYNMNAIIGANNSMETYYFSVDRVAHLDYCDIVFTSAYEELRGERDAMEMRNLVTDYTKNFFNHYILQKAASVENLAYDGVDLIKKTSNKVT
ncbi:alpha/beta hydrolase [Bacillus cabrialesii]|uniref:Choline esterase n=1 Tax=Bacillus cabrialesii subsp. tritici TaxID=2944916 RepID=A0ABT9DKI0_9BACI|nr:choline esterase [Bacillus cabrialesii]AUZ26614.1 choline esterase [Bacillus cereus]MDO8225188.1 choline esterase [Bacillus cabrialesii subsp. tritici]POO75003.1 choline esterase [Bacillus subtilis]